MGKTTAHKTAAFEAFRDINNIHPLGLAAVIILGLIIIFINRRHAVTPMFVMACFVSSAQKVIIPGLNLDFQLLRILILIAFFRIILRSEWRGYSRRGELHPSADSPSGCPVGRFRGPRLAQRSPAQPNNTPGTNPGSGTAANPPGVSTSRLSVSTLTPMIGSITLYKVRVPL